MFFNTLSCEPWLVGFSPGVYYLVIFLHPITWITGVARHLQDCYNYVTFCVCVFFDNGPICRTLFDLLVYTSLSIHINSYNFEVHCKEHTSFLIIENNFSSPYLFFTHEYFLFTITMIFVHFMQHIISTQVCQVSLEHLRRGNDGPHRWHPLFFFGKAFVL